MSTEIAKQILEYLIRLVAPADSLGKGIWDGVGLAGVQNVSGGVFGQHGAVGAALLLSHSSKQAAN